MPVSVREQLLDAIITAVGGVYDVSAPDDERDLPLTVIADDIDSPRDGSYGEHALTLPVTIGRADKSTSTDRDVMRAEAGELLANVIQEMYADETFGGLAEGVDFEGGGIETQVGKFVFAEARFEVRYHFQRGDPYTID